MYIVFTIHCIDIYIVLFWNTIIVFRAIYYRREIHEFFILDKFKNMTLAF